MNILLSSSDPSVIKRWTGLLSPNSTEQAATPAEVISRCAAKTFDLILVHRPLVDIPGFKELRRAVPRGRFFLLSDRPDEDEGLAFLKAGIAGYGNTYISPQRLAQAIKAVSAGGVWLGQKLVQRLIMDMAVQGDDREKPEPAEDPLSGLTKMERKVAGMVAKGMTNMEIAYDLKITERTVKAHLTSIYGKTETGNRLSLALLVNR